MPTPRPAHRFLLALFALTLAGCAATDSGGAGPPERAGRATGGQGDGADAGTHDGSHVAPGGGGARDAGRDSGAPTPGDRGMAGVDAGPVRDTSACKRGVAYGYHSEADMRALSPGVSWWYNWAHLPDEGVRGGAYRSLGVDYMPMTWGRDVDVERLVAEIPDDAGYLLGFNEPNFGDQANISAGDAAALWPQLEEVAERRGLSLVSPAVNYCGGNCLDTDPFHYLHEFLAACQDCRIDAIAMHIYVGCNAQWLIDHVSRYKAEFDHPLWLTEFACDNADSPQTQQQFMRDALTYLESEPRIERYAWFAGRADNVPHVNLLGADGMLTPLGETYATHPHHPDCGL